MDKTSPSQASAERCRICGRGLTGDEKALTRKLINRGATRFLCISCLAGHFEVSEAVLRDKIRAFREMGCTLFGEDQPPAE